MQIRQSAVFKEFFVYNFHNEIFLFTGYFPGQPLGCDRVSMTAGGREFSISAEYPSPGLYFGIFISP